MNTCSFLGHRPRFWADEDVMHWACERCGEGAQKRYPSAEQAQRYARALDREDSEDLGKRAPLVSLFPLRLARSALRRRQKSGQ
jgi:hypothetical protein